MSNTLEYTHREALFNSTAIDEVFYDDATQSLTVDLGGNYYRYHNVPKVVFEDLVGAPSAGRFFRSNIKGTYGVSEKLGDARRVSPQYKMQSSVPAVAMGNVTNINTQPFAQAKFGLTVPSVAKSNKHRVSFDVNGIRHEHTLNAESVDDARSQVLEFGSALGIDFKVKEVTVYFE